MMRRAAGLPSRVGFERIGSNGLVLAEAAWVGLWMGVGRRGVRFAEGPCGVFPVPSLFLCTEAEGWLLRVSRGFLETGVSAFRESWEV